jgi:hypothetical protein
MLKVALHWLQSTVPVSVSQSMLQLTLLLLLQNGQLNVVSTFCAACEGIVIAEFRIGLDVYVQGRGDGVQWMGERGLSVGNSVGG